MATDEIVEGLWYIGQLARRGGPRDGASWSCCCRARPGRTSGAAGFRDATGPDGASLPTRDRASCCFFYTIRPDDTCATLPAHLRDTRAVKLSATAAS